MLFKWVLNLELWHCDQVKCQHRFPISFSQVISDVIYITNHPLLLFRLKRLLDIKRFSCNEIGNCKEFSDFLRWNCEQSLIFCSIALPIKIMQLGKNLKCVCITILKSWNFCTIQHTEIKILSNTSLYIYDYKHGTWL